MYKFFRLTVVFFFALAHFTAYCQDSKPILVGSAKGVLRDTAHNYNLKSATVSIYKTADSSLLIYQISNTYGEFNFKNLPVNVSLRIVVSHVSYQTFSKKFTIPIDKSTIDLKTFIINPKDITLKEVTITVPPIVLNGDTLEFNAAAFKLDSNAVVEDLLRKIPNVTLWGDGQITVNGKEVKSLLVNGKQFFGGDAKIAIQNVAKNALDKIQVYNTLKDKSNPLDSILTVNLKLKKGKNIGHFGKIGAGYGTDKHYEADLSFNVFGPKLQLAIVGASNNINKNLGSIGTLMQNSTFKGVGTNVEYQPDFRVNGISESNATGITFTYNFDDRPTWEKKSTLNSSYFIQNRVTERSTDALTTNIISDTSKVYEKWSNKNTSHSIIQKFNSDYEWISKNHSLKVGQVFSNVNDISDNEIFRNATNTQNLLTSTNNTMAANDNNYLNFNLRLDYGHTGDYKGLKQLFGDFKATYAIEIGEEGHNILNITDFKSYINATANRKFNRKYDKDKNTVSQQLNFEFQDLESILFGKKQLADIGIGLTNELNFIKTKDKNRVEDVNLSSNEYEDNKYLTNQINTDYLDETIGLNFQKSFNHSLSNRYSKHLQIIFAPKQQIIHQINQSDRSIQNIKRNYNLIRPDLSINYSNNQYGEYSRSMSLNYNTKLLIPNIYQLAPLVDSTDLYNVQRGNINLRAGIERSLNLSFSHYDQASKKTLNYGVNVAIGLIEDNIIDSTFIDSQNRRNIYFTNANGNKYINFSGNVRKAFKLKTGEMQVDLNTYVTTNKNPEYINNVFTFSSNFNTTSSLGLNYTYKEYLALAFKQTYGTYKSKQEAFNTQYSGANIATTLSSSYNITKKFTINTNISFNKSKSENAADINFAIWNASAVYRFLKGNNAELKVSALDLLHQNTNIINYGNSNSFTFGTQNVLQQYFMTTFSYYPRQFGKKAVKK